jgi:hypothetical protein
LTLRISELGDEVAFEGQISTAVKLAAGFVFAGTVSSSQAIPHGCMGQLAVPAW